MKGHGEKKSRKEDIAILSLLSEPTMKDAAEKTGIGEATLWRWMQKPAFKEKYNNAKREVVAQATSRLRQSMTIAVEALVEMAENSGTPAMARASACRTLLEFGFKAHEMEDLQERVERLEESIKENAS
jgi:transposase-like protein